MSTTVHAPSLTAPILRRAAQQMITALPGCGNTGVLQCLHEFVTR